jgi:hypothetical protein
MEISCKKRAMNDGDDLNRDPDQAPEPELSFVEDNDNIIFARF